jgi:hypothetical protein
MVALLDYAQEPRSERPVREREHKIGAQHTPERGSFLPWNIFSSRIILLLKKVSLRLKYRSVPMLDQYKKRTHEH